MKWSNDELIEKYFEQILTFREKEEFNQRIQQREFKDAVFKEYLFRKSLNEVEIDANPEELEVSIWDIEQQVLAERKKKKIKILLAIGIGGIVLIALLLFILS